MAQRGIRRGAARRAACSAAMAMAVALSFGFPTGAWGAAIGDCTVEVAPASYAGKPVQPKLVVKCDERELERGVDYVTAWRRNVNAGVARVTVIGRGAFTGRKTAFFAIARADVSDVDISGVEKSYRASGHAIEPKPKVVLEGRVLREGLDYRLSYGRNAQAGSGWVRVTGMRNLAGARTLRFTVKAP